MYGGLCRDRFMWIDQTVIKYEITIIKKNFNIIWFLSKSIIAYVVGVGQGYRKPLIGFEECLP